MNSIIELPRSKRCMSIFMIMDYLFKYTMFIPVPKECMAEVTVELFIRHIVKYWDLSAFIVSDQDS